MMKALSSVAKKELDSFNNKNAPLVGFYQTFCITDALEGNLYDKENICEKFNSDKLNGFILGQVVTFGIVAINFILRLLIIKLIIYIGKDTESEQTRLITNGVFIVQFFNTALLLLMVNANMNEQGSMLSLLSRDSGFPDFNTEWFN